MDRITEVKLGWDSRKCHWTIDVTKQGDDVLEIHRRIGSMDIETAFGIAAEMVEALGEPEEELVEAGE